MLKKILIKIYCLLSQEPSSKRLSRLRLSEDGAGLVGLRNIGNTCFMNSVIQCLSNTKPLLEYLLSEKHLSDINTSVSSMKGALIKAFSQVIQELWKVEHDGVVNTTALKSQIQRFAPRFMGYNQQDAQEFLRYLLEGLHEDVNRIPCKPKPILTDVDEMLSSTAEDGEIEVFKTATTNFKTGGSVLHYAILYMPQHDGVTTFTSSMQFCYEIVNICGGSADICSFKGSNGKKSNLLRPGDREGQYTSLGKSCLATHNDHQKAVESWKRYLRMDDSKIVDLFVGQLKSTLRCSSCGHCSITFDPFWDLSLPIPSRTGQLRLQQCLDHFTKEEVLDGDEKPGVIHFIKKCCVQ
uniref:ubiquitinyl hydrolase 1 n=1 Tax=Timema douglasi TaxID=61478 RepID=A0A7R8VP21_TIMDO|nr:unnamed protein product [Timema douglasi]